MTRPAAGVTATSTQNWRAKLWREIRGYAEALIIAYLIVTFAFTTVGVSGTSMEPNLNGGSQGDSLIQSLLKGDRVLIPKYETWLKRAGLLGPYTRGEIVVLREPANAPTALITGKRNFYIKRIIGVPGDHVRIEGGRVHINGAPLDQTFITNAGTIGIAPIDFPRVALEDGQAVALVMNFRATPTGIATPDLPFAHATGPQIPFNDPRLQLFYGTVMDRLAVPQNGADPDLMVVDYVVPAGEYFVMGDNRSRYGSEDSRYFGSIPSLSIAGRATAVIWPPVREGKTNLRILRIPEAFNAPIQGH